MVYDYLWRKFCQLNKDKLDIVDISSFSYYNRCNLKEKEDTYMRISRLNYPNITITFKKKNGEMWEERYSSYALDIFKKDPEVYEIRSTDTGKLIYRRDT